MRTGKQDRFFACPILQVKDGGILKYNKLSQELVERIEKDREQGVKNPFAFQDQNIIRRNLNRDKANLWRPAFVRDVEKIMHSPYYNRYADKTQVFSFYKNDDITRRALHVQFVSRIARNIGRLLNLNEDLIEAIALGHDIGHTPFGHAGERMLSRLYQKKTGRYFNHNVHSVRVLDGIFVRNISLQVLDGILCHNGEFAMKEYRPGRLDSFEVFDQKVESCYVDESNIETLIPCTLEGCVVRISDMIAYLGKDRQDSQKANILKDVSVFTKGEIGVENAEIVNNLVVNIVENSYGKDYIYMDDEYYKALKLAKSENNQYIYQNDSVNTEYEKCIYPMFEAVYEKLLDDLEHERKESVIFKHHIDFVNQQRGYYDAGKYFEETENNQIVVDYMASMTDDYFVDLYQYLFPDGKYEIHYVPYFKEEQ